MSITLQDIAKKCNVSTATVSLVLSDHPRIPKPTKKKILKVIKQTGYYPNLAARMLSTKNTKTLCVVVPEISHIFSNPFFGEVISGIYDYSSKQNYRLLFEVATYEFCFYKRYLQLFRERSIDGMLYVGSTLKDTYLVDLEKEKVPFMLIGSYFMNNGPKLSYVIGDNFNGGYIATKHLIDLGHRNIGIVTGSFKVVSARDRYLGYKKALKESKIPFNKSWVIKANFDEKSSYESMTKFLVQQRNNTITQQRLTAVFAGNDLMAFGVIRAVEESGLKVPQDISVVGMDNIRMTSFGESHLTTVEYNTYEMGKLAAKKIIEQIENKNSNEQIKKILPVKLIVRKTTEKVKSTESDSV